MQKPLEISIEPTGLVVLTFTGDLLEENIPAFQETLEQAAATIGQDLGPRKVKTLLDLTHFSGKYCPRALELLVWFAKTNAVHIEKSASFGGNMAIKLAGEIVTELANRDNIKIFDTKEEAVAWLDVK